MVFSSLIFLWIFLPIVLLVYFIAGKRLRNVVLLIASLVFYAWGEPKYILLMLISIFVNWIIGLFMDQCEKYKKPLLIVAVICNLGLLGYFKYFNFLIDIVNHCIGSEIAYQEIRLPIGISFFTFQILSYVIDLYRRQYKVQKNLINLALYISFFPQLIAGPIVKYKDIDVQLAHREITTNKLADGIRRFIYGLGKKVLIANVAAKCVDTIFALDYVEVTGWLAWAAAILYMLQIYYDFSGYSDMAIGLGKIFGFEFQENFCYPYLSRSIQEFWQRWHISLGTWFKEYLYIPLGGNRKGKVRTYINLLIVFGATGLWHGASMNFVLWGLYHGSFSILERMGLRERLTKHPVFSHLYAMLVVVFGWVLFRAENLRQAGRYVKRMLLPWMYTNTNVKWQILFGNRTILMIIVGILGTGMMQQFLKKKCSIEKWKYSIPELLICAGIFLLCIANLASNTYNPFIYFRF